MVSSKSIICILCISLILAFADSLFGASTRQVTSDDIQSPDVYSVQTTSSTAGAGMAMIVPEPATIALLGASSLVLIRTRRNG